MTEPRARQSPCWRLRRRDLRSVRHPPSCSGRYRRGTSAPRFGEHPGHAGLRVRMGRDSCAQSPRGLQAVGQVDQVDQVHVHSGGARNRPPEPGRPATRTSAGSSRACSACNASSHHARTPERRRARDRRRFRQPGVVAFRRRPVVLEDSLHLDSDKSVPGMLSPHGRTTLFTDDFWNVRHIRTTADSNGRVRVVARVAPASIALFPPASLTPARKPHDGPGSVPESARRNPTLKRRPESVEFPGGRVPRPRKQDTALSGLSRGSVGRDLVEVVGGAALAPVAAANPRVLMTPGGHMAPNALRPLRRPRSRRPWPGPGCCNRIVVSCCSRIVGPP